MTWKRTERAAATRPCGLCRSEDVVVVQAEELREGLARLNPRWQPAIRVYERCRACGARNQHAEELLSA